MDISSLNRKQSEVFVALPRGLDSLETKVRDKVNGAVCRGRISVKIAMQMSDGVSPVNFNEKVALDYVKKLRILSKKLNIPCDLSIEKLIVIPGIFENKAEELSPDTAWTYIRGALEKALTEFIAMRDREGRNMERELMNRISGLKKILTKIEAESEKLPQKQREALLKRIQQAGLEGVNSEDPRVVQEVIFYADRSDITEEITRLKSHFSQFDHATTSTEPVGRMLDFLAQEMGREINTIGSKANDGTIAAHVVKFKAELEKFREQVQNIE